MPEQDDLRVWISCSNIPDLDYINLLSIKDGVDMIRVEIAKHLEDESITDNSFGIQVYEEIEGKLQWNEWYAEDGRDVMETIEHEDETDFYFIFVYGCVEPEMIGPFKSAYERDEAAIAKRKEEGAEHGYYRLDTSKEAEVGMDAYAHGELGVE